MKINALVFSNNDIMIPHNKPTLGIEEENAALRIIRSGWMAQGPEVELFENDFCKFMGIPQGHAIAVSNGTAAVYLSLLSLNAHNDNISIPSYTCSVLRNTINFVGNQETILDISPNSPNIDVNEISKTKSKIAIIPHMYGIPVDFTTLQSTTVIEDCAQSLGAELHGKYVGLHGELGIFSFHATKLITSGGQGGMIISKNKTLLDKIRDLREYGKQDKTLRLNFQMTDLQAAIGREQLKKLPSFLQRRSEIFEMYKESGLDLLDVIPNKKHIIKPKRYRAIMRTKRPEHIIKVLASENIRATVLIDSLGLLGDPNSFPNASQLSLESVSLPIFPSLLDNDVYKIISILKKNNAI